MPEPPKLETKKKLPDDILSDIEELDGEESEDLHGWEDE